MTTETAQRRLLESLGELYNTTGRDIGTSSDPLEALHHGVAAAVAFMLASEEPGVAVVYGAFADLIAAVREDHIRAGVTA